MFKTSQVIVSVSTIAVGTVFKSSGKKAEADKNGKAPVSLTILAGTAPKNRNIISGTVAESLNLEANKTYALQIREGEPNDYGRQFIFEAAEKINSIMDRITAIDSMGAPVLVDVSADVKDEGKVIDKVENFNEA